MCFVAYLPPSLGLVLYSAKAGEAAKASTTATKP